MAKGFEVETVIAAPPDRVWAAMTDFAQAPRWMPGLHEVAPKDDRPLGAGKVFAVTMSTKGRGKQRDMTLSDWHPSDRFALSSPEGGVTATYTYSLTPDGKGTCVKLLGICEAKGLFWRLLHPLIVKMMAKHDGAQVDLLKDLIEQGGSR